MKRVCLSPSLFVIPVPCHCIKCLQLGYPVSAAHLVYKQLFAYVCRHAYKRNTPLVCPPRYHA